jgi:hypothetical protein
MGDLGPGAFGEHAAGAAVLGGVLVRRIAVEAAFVDALADGGEAEHGEGEVEIPLRDALAAGAAAIGCHIVGFARDAALSLLRHYPSAVMLLHQQSGRVEKGLNLVF